MKPVDIRSWLHPCTMKPRNLLAIVSGILVGTSYIPFPPWAIFFCWIPLWIAWLQEENLTKQTVKKTVKNIFWTGWLTQFFLTAIGFTWVSYTVHEFGNLPWIAAIAVHFAYCSFASLHVPLSGVAWFVFSQKLSLGRWQKIVALPIFMNLGERLYPMIFDWHSGYTWIWAKFPAYQLADIWGFIGLSLIAMIFNTLWLTAYLRRKERKSWIGLATSVPALFLTLNIWGYFHARQFPSPDASTKILIVQANVGNQEKLAAEAGSAYRDIVIDRFVDMTAKGLATGPADYAVWPETAFPEVIDEPTLSRGYPYKLKLSLQKMNTGLITGTYSRHRKTGQITNSFVVLDKNGQWVAPPYHKTILLAFGEYFPLADYIPGLREAFPEVGNFGRGPGPTVIDAGFFKLGAQVCYEGLFDWFTRRLGQHGAEVLVNVTNDSWYGTWQQPYQHMYMTLARAIEVRRPLVRSTNTGISTVILANGDILEQSPLHEEWFYLYQIPYVKNPPSTIFMGWGYWLFPVLMGLTLIGLPLTRSSIARKAGRAKDGNQLTYDKSGLG